MFYAFLYIPGYKCYFCEYRCNLSNRSALRKHTTTYHPDKVCTVVRILQGAVMTEPLLYEELSQQRVEKAAPPMQDAGRVEKAALLVHDAGILSDAYLHRLNI